MLLVISVPQLRHFIGSLRKLVFNKFPEIFLFSFVEKTSLSFCFNYSEGKIIAGENHAGYDFCGETAACRF